MLFGPITQVPELRFTPTGKAVCVFAIKCWEKDISCEAWESVAEIIGGDYDKYIVGYEICIHGYWKTRTWENRDGKTISRRVYVVQEVS